MENGVNGEVNGVSEDPPRENGVTEDDGREQEKQVEPEKSAKKIRVTYEEYRTIANLLILHLRQLEESSEEEEGVACDGHVIQAGDHVIPPNIM